MALATIPRIALELEGDVAAGGRLWRQAAATLGPFCLRFSLVVYEDGSAGLTLTRQRDDALVARLDLPAPAGAELRAGLLPKE